MGSIYQDGKTFRLLKTVRDKCLLDFRDGLLRKLPQEGYNKVLRSVKGLSRLKRGSTKREVVYSPRGNDAREEVLLGKQVCQASFERVKAIRKS